MTTTPENVRALFADLHHTDAGRLLAADRRREGEDLPTIPLPELGVELTRAEAACALFESLADELRDPDTDTLTAALTGAVRTLGTEHIREQLPVFHDLGLEEFFEVTQCWQWAHRLTLSYWYAGARSRTMTAGEVAVCLYLSDLQQCRQAEFRRQPQRALVLARAVHQGADRVPADTLVCLGEGFAAELGGIARDRGTVPKAYRSTMPDYHRRRLCFSLAHADSADQPVPLIVRHNEDDGGGYALGLTAPRQPGRTHFRTLRARW